MNEDGY
ncbi:Protein of unknown function [Escherichia coli]|nr:Protein of unknown function [Escherichia coli]CDU37601.1 Protein of unknown function [Escherichia coli]